MLTVVLPNKDIVCTVTRLLSHLEDDAIETLAFEQQDEQHTKPSSPFDFPVRCTNNVMYVLPCLPASDIDPQSVANILKCI